MRTLFVSPTYITKELEYAYFNHVNSIAKQKGDFLHVVIDDASPSPTVRNIQHDKMVIIRNDKNVGSPLDSTMKGIKQYSKPDDIVAIVDGDDWLLVDNVPEILSDVYSRGVEAAWTNFLQSNGTPGWCSWFPEIVHPREQWLSSHLKTFRADLINRIDDSVLRNGNGGYVNYVGDCALYWAILEKSYKRAFIPRLLYCYNLGNPISERNKDQEAVAKYSKMLQERRQDTRGQPSRRGVIDTGRVCNENCQFCYYRHEKCKKEFAPLESMKALAFKMKGSGLNYIDLTGGEPSIHPDIKGLIDYIHKIDMKVCMITNAQAGMDFGCDDYLVSLHGAKATHDALVEKQGAYDVLINNCKSLSATGMRFRFNCVINKFNAGELLEIAKIMSSFNPKIVNFINFNPYYNWSQNAGEIQAKYSDFTKSLSDAIDFLDEKKIGVNVRYLPFCQLKGKERNICGIMQHIFDDYEWNNDGMNTAQAMDYVLKLRAQNNACDNPACKACSLCDICDGQNKHYAQRNGKLELKPYVNGFPRFSVYDLYKFRFPYDEVHIR